MGGNGDTFIKFLLLLAMPVAVAQEVYSLHAAGVQLAARHWNTDHAGGERQK